MQLLHMTMTTCKNMDYNDIITVEITQEMIRKAERERDWLDTKTGNKTKLLTERHNIVGSLGHQAVEEALDEFGYDFKTCRTKKYQHGDTVDIIYENDHIDIKATASKYNPKFYYNQEFLVLCDQIEDEKYKTITHLLFVSISQDYSIARIFGVISKSDLLRYGYSIGPNNYLKHKNIGIRAHKLYPLRKY